MDQEVADLHALVREAHECIKDLNKIMKKADDTIDRLEAAVSKKVDEEVGVIVSEFLAKYADSMNAAIKDAEAAVFKRFDDMTAVLLGETHKHRVKGEQSLPDIAQEIADAKAAAKAEATRII